MSINWKKSAELNNMTVDDLKVYFDKYPNSGKLIIAVCDGDCNRVDRVVRKADYKNLCISCTLKKRYEDPKERKKTSLANKKRFEDPKERKKIGLALKQAHINDPTISQRMTKSQKERYNNPKNREIKSIESKNVHKNDPAKALRQGESLRRAHRNDPTIGKRLSKSLIEANKNDPTISQRRSESHKIYNQNKRWNNQVDNFINGDPIYDWIVRPTYNYGILKEDYDIWRYKVYKRDNYTCQICGLDHCEVNAHHIIPRRNNQDLILDVSNGITMCRKCHELTYGKEELFIEELQMMVNKTI